MRQARSWLVRTVRAGSRRGLPRSARGTGFALVPSFPVGAGGELLKRTWTGLAIAVAACGGPNPGTGDVPVDTLRIADSRLIARDELRGEMPFGVAELDGRILIAVAGADSLLALYDSSGTALRHFLREGEGPREALEPTHLASQGEAVWAWDRVLTRLIPVRPGAEPPVGPVRTVPGGEGWMQAWPLGDGVLLAGGSVENALFAVWRSGAAAPEPRGDLPPVAAAHWGVPWGLVPSRAALAPSGDRLAVVFPHSGELVIAAVPDGKTLAAFRAGDGEVEIDAKRYRLLSPVGYLNVVADADAVYAAWVGRPWEWDRMPYFPTVEVHVFDWEGVPKRRLVLDAPDVPVAAFGDRLYTIGLEPLPEVRRWRVPG